jgi:queuosine precursor transporter
MDDPETFEADLHVDDVRYTRYERGYLFLAATFVTALLLTNIIGIKLFRSPIEAEFALTTGIITYPLTFLITDLVSEIYGRRRADVMVIIGFVMSLLMLVIVQIAIHVEPHPYWVPGQGAYYDDVAGYQTAFEASFSMSGILVFGSMSAYAVAQLADNRIYHWIKRRTDGKHLWLRNNGSTWISQGLDTIVVNSILFYIGFKMDFAVGAGIMFTIYWHKLIIAALDTPLIYLGVFLLKRWIAADPHPEATR